MSRSGYDGRSQIILGDLTSHGGVVISGAPSHFWHDIPIVRKTDRVTCPRCKPHIFEVAEGLSNATDNGLPMTMEGHKTTCGAVLIAKQASASRFAAALRMADDLISEKKYAYDEQFVVAGEDGVPMEGLSYVIKTASGQKFYGVTNEKGETQRVGTDAAENLELILGDDDGNDE